jgi:hypothetical protein
MAPAGADEAADSPPTAESATSPTTSGQAYRRHTRLLGWFNKRTQPHRAALAWLAVTIALGAAGVTRVPAAGLDPSWFTVLGRAAAEHRRFGHDLVFTFGPWGFLDRPVLFTGRHFTLGVLFEVAATTAMFCAAYACVKRKWSPRIAAPAAFGFTVATIVGDPGPRIICAGLVFALLTIARRGATKSQASPDAWPTVLLAAGAALMVQVKLSEGLALFALAGIVAISVRTLRAFAVNVAAAVATFTVTFLLLWLIAGQRLGDLASWLRYSWELASGYEGAMAMPPDTIEGYGLAALLALIAVTLAVGMARRYRGLVGLGVVLLVVAMLEFAFKDGFIRKGGYTYFTIGAFVLIALASYARRPAAVLAAAAVALVLVPTSLDQFDPFAARDRWRRSAEAILNTDHRLQMQAAAAGQARAEYQLSARMVAASKGHPVSVDLWEATLPWAYSLNWNPVPVFQAYAAYTPALDELNAHAIATAPSDQIVLRQNQDTIDARNTRWETPRYLLALACNYKVEMNEGRWSLLRHGENSCSQPRNLGVRTVNTGEVVEAPTVGPNEILVARFTPRSDGLLTSVTRAVLKDRSSLVVTADDRPYRLPKGLAGSPLMVSFPETLGWAEPFNDFHYKHLSFNRAGTLEFQVVPVR